MFVKVKSSWLRIKLIRLRNNFVCGGFLCIDLILELKCEKERRGWDYSKIWVGWLLVEIDGRRLNVNRSGHASSRG